MDAIGQTSSFAPSEDFDCAFYPGSSTWRTLEIGMARCRYATQGVYATAHEKRGVSDRTHDPRRVPGIHRAVAERRLDTQRVFLYKGKPVRDIRTAFDKACRRAGIWNLRLHDLRHTASTNLRQAGVDPTTAMKIVGHKSERMHRRYNTVKPEDLRRAVSQLAAYTANTVITPGAIAAGAETLTPCLSNVRP